MARPSSAATALANSSRGKHLVDAGGFRGLGTGEEAGAEHDVLAAVVARVEEEGGLFRAAVDQQDRARLDDAAEIEELVALAERLLAGALGRALQDRDSIADLRHDARTASGVFVGREDVGEDGLGTQAEGQREQQ